MYYFQRTDLGRILMGIDNIAAQCYKRIDIPIDGMTLDEKLHRIRVSHGNFVLT